MKRIILPAKNIFKSVYFSVCLSACSHTSCILTATYYHAQQKSITPLLMDIYAISNFFVITNNVITNLNMCTHQLDR